MATRLATAALVTTLAACGGEVVQAATTTGGSGGGGATATTSGSTSTSTSGQGGAPAACVPQAEGSGGVLLQPTCADLAVMTVSDPVLTDDGGDGKLAFNESAILTVKLNEVAGKGFNWYPGVTFTSDTISVDAAGAAQFYAILPCTSMDAITKVSLLTTVAPGTVVHMKAQVSMLGASCPEAPSVDVPILIQ